MIIKKRNKNLFLYNLKLVVLSIAIIMIWRWVWNFLDEYFLPNYFILSNILSIVVGIIILYINDYDLDELWVSDD